MKPWEIGIKGKPAPVKGWATCGTVNAKNRYGGYVGAVRVLAFVRMGSDFVAELGEADELSFADIACHRMEKAGFQPAADATAPAAPVATAPGAPGPLGFAGQYGEAGFRVVAVRPGSMAARAGIAPGTLITHVAGTLLSSLPIPAMAALLRTAGSGAVLTLGDGRRVTFTEK